MNLRNFSELHNFYKAQLFYDCVPFWMEHSLDHQYGGYLTILERDGTPYGFGKYVWPQAREAWLFARLYNTVEKKPEWLEASCLGVDFLRKHALDEDGQAYYKLSREGAPIYSRPWQIFSECFLVIAMAEFAKASGEDEYLQIAKKIYWNIVKRLQNADLDKYAFIQNRLFKEHAVSMIMLNTTQELRVVEDNPQFAGLIQSWLHEELYVYAKDEQKALFERVRPDGSLILSEPEGRSVVPGHCMETCWFCLREGDYLEDKKIIQRASQILDWTLELGWDKTFGGLFNFIDYENKPPGHHDEDWGEDQDWDEKLWWVHSEALYALLLAYKLTGKEKYMEWYEKVHYWSFKYFPDPQYGEWFGYLRRDGSVSQTLKGCMKGFFHLPRALLNCTQLLEKRKILTNAREKFLQQ